MRRTVCTLLATLAVMLPSSSRPQQATDVQPSAPTIPNPYIDAQGGNAIDLINESLSSVGQPQEVNAQVLAITRRATEVAAVVQQQLTQFNRDNPYLAVKGFTIGLGPVSVDFELKPAPLPPPVVSPTPVPTGRIGTPQPPW